MSKCVHIIGLDNEREAHLIYDGDLVAYGEHALLMVKDYKNKCYMQKFKYCPDCGIKLNWKKIKKEIRDYFKMLEI